MRVPPAVTVLLLALGSTLTAGEVRCQVADGEFGFTVMNSSGDSAGVACWGTTCTPHQLSAQAGTPLDLLIRAPLNQPFWIGVSTLPLGCVQLPFAEHGLILNPSSMTTLAAGVIVERNTLRFCWNGVVTQQATIPAAVPPGTQFALQALSVVPSPSGPERLTFSAAVLATVF